MNDAPQDEPYHVFPYVAIDDPSWEGHEEEFPYPDPPVPEDASLGKLHWMQFDVKRYRGSTFAMTASLAGQGAAFNLWLYAWEQPGICLPNDERVLARVCGLKWTDQEWKDIRDEAIDKFYLCSNGKLYHPYLSEIGRDAWDGYQKKVEGGKKGASRRYGEGDPLGTPKSTPKSDPMVHNSTYTLQDTKEGTLSGKKPRRRPKAPVKEIIEYLNEKAGTAFRPDTQATIRTLDTRWKEFDNIKAYLLVIDYICANWLKDEKMAPYVRPPTIFQASKFEGYLESAWKWADKIDYTDESMKENWDGIISGDNEQDRPGPSEDVHG